MKSLVILAAGEKSLNPTNFFYIIYLIIFHFFLLVLLFSQAAKVPQDVTHHVTITIPSNVLAASSPTTISPKEIPAHVVEVSKNQKPLTNMTPNTSQMITMKPQSITTMTNQMETTTPSKVTTKMLRKTRAVPFKDNEQSQPQLTTDVNKIKAILAQNKRTMKNNMPLQRSMRSLPVEMKTEQPSTQMPLTQNPVITKVDSPMSTIDPCDLLCTKFEFDPICASNGVCLHEFPNQCILDTYNCKHAKHKFSATKDDRCQMHWLTKCDENEMM